MLLGGKEVVSKEKVEVAAWVCYVNSAHGHADLKITQKPAWTDSVQRMQFTRQAVEALQLAGVEVEV